MQFLLCPTRPMRSIERWAHIHEPPITRGEDVPSEHDVFETVAAVEEVLLETLNLNLSGNTIMTSTTSAPVANTTGKTHTLPANPVISEMLPTTMPAHHNYFDPIDTLEDHLALHPQLHSRVLNSAAWMIDMACINAARNIVFTRYAESELAAETEDRFGTFCQGIAEVLAHESFYNTTEDTPESTLATLISMSHYWHDCAARAYSANNQDYAPKSFDELLLSEKPRMADAGTRANYEAIAKAEARGDEAKYKRFMDAFLEADRLAAMQRSDNNRKLIPVLSITLATVSRHARADARFDELPIDTQRKLTTQILRSFDRVKLDLARVMARETVMFGHMLEAIYQCTESLEKMIAAKYTQVGELEYAGVPHSVTQFDRQQKAAAATRT